MSDENILVLEGIEKSFFGAKVLHDINLTVRKGEVLGLVGENGAGKSTLMNILGGVLPKDAGTMTLNGHAYEPVTPKDAQKACIAFIHQELSLFSNLSVAENMFIDELPTGALWSVKYGLMQSKAQEYIEKFALPVTPKTKISTLPMGVRQTVEITKALIKNVEIIIFDEPTTSLSQKEKENLFNLIQQLHQSGVTIIYISHILEDVFQLCDRIAVLRDGHVIGVEEKNGLSKAQVIKMMVGRDLNQVYPTIEKTVGEQVYSAQHISQGSAVKDVSFDLCKGEVVGLFGLMGAGRTELMRCLFGVDKMDHGEICFKGQTFRKLNPQVCIEQGMAFVTEDRRQEGLIMTKPVHDNLVLVKLDQMLEKLGMVSRKKEDAESDQIIKELGIKVYDKDKQPVSNLSGGNQQKVVLGKWILRAPEMLIMDEPTRGVDVGAKYEIYVTINEMAKNGACILVVSSEMEELMGICDRMLVMHRGRIVAEFKKGAYHPEEIIRYALEGGKEA